MDKRIRQAALITLSKYANWAIPVLANRGIKMNVDMMDTLVNVSCVGVCV